MSSIFIVIFGLIGFSFGWFVYSKFIAEKIYQLDPNYETPAHRFEDGVDYVPTNKFVLWGSHFTAVAGAAPIVGPAIAVYWGWAPALLWVGCLKLSWFPCSGWGGFFDSRLVIPAIVMGVPGIAGITRIMRASTLDVLGQDFIRTARAKGLSEWRVNSGHVFQNAMIPIVTILAFSFAGLIGGAFITETILGIPGIGRFAVDSIFDRDYPVIMAITLVGSMAFVIANLIADVAYAFIDPRIRLN